MKRNLLISLAVLLALILTAAASAEAPEIRRVGDYIRLCEYGEVPESFDSGFNRTVETQLNGVLFRVADAFITPSHAIILTEIRMADGSPALFRDTYCDPDTVTVAQLRYDPDDEDPRTLREYAEEKNLPIIPVCVDCIISDSFSGTNYMWLQDDSSAIVATNIWFHISNVRTVDVSVIAVTNPLNPFSGTGNEPDNAEETLYMKIPVSPEVSRFIPVGQTVSSPFGPVTLDSLTVRRSALETIVDTAFCLEDLGTDASAIPEDLENYSFAPVDPESREIAWSFLSDGYGNAKKYGIDRNSQRILFFRNCTVSLPAGADSLTLAFVRGYRDPEENQELLTVSIPVLE